MTIEVKIKLINETIHTLLTVYDKFKTSNNDVEKNIAEAVKTQLLDLLTSNAYSNW